MSYFATALKLIKNPGEIVLGGFMDERDFVKQSLRIIADAINCSDVDSVIYEVWS